MTSFVTNVCLIFLFIVFIELSRYGKFPEFFRKNSGKFPTFYFSGKVTTLLNTTYSVKQGFRDKHLNFVCLTDAIFLKIVEIKIIT